MLDFSNLEKAISNLEYWLHEMQNDPMMIHACSEKKNGFRAALIQYYEIAYELSWKMMERWLKNNTDENVELRYDLFRLAKKYELIDDVSLWIEYNRFRNNTSHEYDEDKSNALVEIIPKFIIQSNHLLENFKKLENAKLEDINETN